jgi:hypothetical protein
MTSAASPAIAPNAANAIASGLIARSACAVVTDRSWNVGSRVVRTRLIDCWVETA